MDEGCEMVDALVVGAGPAGLMAAEVLARAGRSVVIAEAKPSPARKFLMAGKSGLNLTKAEPPENFLAAYGDAAGRLAPMLAAFGPDEVIAWVQGLGARTFTGSTGRVFPTELKASPLTRAWLARLDGLGVTMRRRWRWTGWDGPAATFATPDGPRRSAARATVLALGGASWARLGSDGAWTALLQATGVRLTPFAPANAAIAIGWSAHMAPHFGAPLKAVALTAGGITSRGECVLSARGLEGGGVYLLTPAIRAGAALTLDLKPDLSLAETAARLTAHGTLRSRDRLRRLGLSAPAIALLHEFARPLPEGPDLAGAVKALPVPHQGPAPMDGAISTAGGVAWESLDPGLMLRTKPGVFIAGEMIDWEAPTGGYLITACLATGAWAGRAAQAWLNTDT